MSKNQKKIVYAVLAVLLSSILWLYVSVLTDPEYQTEIKGVPIEYIGEEVLNSRNLYVVENMTGTLRLTFDGRRTDLSLLDNKNVSVVVDLSNITASGTYNRAYEVNLPDNVKDSVRLSVRSSQYVDLFIDKTETKVVEVRLVPNISPAEGFIVETNAATVEPHEIRIKGPSTILDKIEYAEVTLNYEDVSQTVDSVKPYKFKDIDGNEVSSGSLTSDDPEVHILVPVSKTKTVALEVEFRDGGGITLADNVNYSIVPSEITISGDPADLEGINTLMLPTIDLSKVVSSGDRSYKIPIPNGCENISGQENAVVTIEIIGTQTELLSVTNFDVINESPPEGYEVVIVNEAMSVQIRGPENVVQAVKPYNIRVVADLNGIELKPGSSYYTAIVYVDGYSNVGAVGEYRLAVSVRTITEE